MFEIPRNFLTSVALPASATNKTVRFQVIAEDEHPTIIAIERRRMPSRRKPTLDEKQKIERRVSFDRRRTTFSRKA